MAGKIILENKDDLGSFQYDLFEAPEPIDYQIEIHTDLTDDFIKLTSTIGDMKDSIQLLAMISDDPDYLKFCEKHKDHLLELLNKAEYVTLRFPLVQTMEYMKKNPILKTKKIILEDIYDMDPKIVETIEDQLGNETTNIYFDIADNDHLIHFNEYKETVNIIHHIIQNIEQFPFSPLEKIMYTYDIVRDRVYVEEDENENKAKSRSLSDILLGNKIVCLGYARLFHTLLMKMNLDSRLVYLFNSQKTGGHARNEVYIKDEKYHIDGVYYFDPTWDAKQSENDDTFLSSYRYFAMTKSAVDSLDHGKRKDLNFPYFSNSIDLEIEDLINQYGLENLPKEFVDSINYMSKRIDHKILINSPKFYSIIPNQMKPNKEDIIKSAIQLTEYFYYPLPAEILLEALYNVRKYQYYINPEKYKLSLNEFHKIIMHSNWEFESDWITSPLLSLEDKGYKCAYQLKEYSDENELEKHIAQVKLAKTLRLTYEKRKNKNL